MREGVSGRGTVVRVSVAEVEAAKMLVERAHRAGAVPDPALRLIAEAVRFRKDEES